MSRFIRAVLIIIGLGLAFYPWISNFIYEKNEGSKVGIYEDMVKRLTKERYDSLLEDAQKYNECLVSSHVVLTDPFHQRLEGQSENLRYEALLAVDDSGVIGQIEVPCIKIKLPIYRGTSNTVLEKGIGHLEGTSIPVGGEDTHAVLTGHTGLNASKLFTDLIKVEEGDLFYIHILNKDLAYRVDDIRVVVPEDTDNLAIVKGKDYVTLVTCTPYGVNSHRLLVRGIRTDYIEEEYLEERKKNRSSIWMEEYKKALLIGVIVALLLIVSIMLFRKRGNRARC